MYEFNTGGQPFTFTLIKADNSRVDATTNVTARRNIDGGGWANCTGTVSVVETNKLQIVFSAADLNGSIISFVFDDTDAVQPVCIDVRTNKDTARALFRTPLIIRTFVGLDDSQVEVMDCLGAAFLSLMGVETPDDLLLTTPSIDLTYPGGTTVIATYDIYSDVSDYMGDRPIKRFRASAAPARNVTAITAPTVDDCLMAAFVLAACEDSIVGTTMTRKQPDNTATFVTYTLNSSTAPTAKDR